MTRGFPARRIDRGCRQSVYLRSERRKRGGDVRLSRGINRRWQDSVAKSAELRSSCTSPTISCVSSRAHPATSTEVGSLTHRETPVCVHAPPFERKRKREWLDSKKSKNSLPVYESLSLSLSPFHRRSMFTLSPLCTFTRARVARRWLAAADVHVFRTEEEQNASGRRGGQRRFSEWLVKKDYTSGARVPRSETRSISLKLSNGISFLNYHADPLFRFYNTRRTPLRLFRLRVASTSRLIRAANDDLTKQRNDSSVTTTKQLLKRIYH